ncbi:OmpA family protein [Azohydromonas lata]|uniref:OmpA family protein n=1 Tax=Azohydromonas lata TaxID=45677 RepID=UPI0012F4E4A4|nr:OmpA family protein [Azohydromonas lata]
MKHRLMLTTLALALASATALVAEPLRAQEVRLYGEQEAVDPQDVAAILGAPRKIKYRALRLLDDAPAAPQQMALATTGQADPGAPPSTAAATVAAAADGAPAAAQSTSALALPVQFAFNSADLLPAARRQLDALAQGIKLLPASRAVLIEGHTDAAGSQVYNEQLSLRRAQSVRRYLVAQYGIEPARLRAVGLGEYDPLPGRDPHAPQNRRVQFRGE